MDSRSRTLIAECYWAARVKGNWMREGWKKVGRAKTQFAPFGKEGNGLYYDG